MKEEGTHKPSIRQKGFQFFHQIKKSKMCVKNALHFILAIFGLTYARQLTGISFIVKSCMEPFLYESVKSLSNLHVPHEIRIILHHCAGHDVEGLQTARQLEKENSNVTVFEYPYRISRPGYETLATNADSLHSLIRFFNFGLEKAKYKWIAKWDADFWMPPALTEWINSAEIWHLDNQVVSIEAISASHTEIHDYFSSSLSHYFKYAFSEMPNQQIIPTTHVRNNLVNSSVFIHHNSTFTNLKPYWWARPWYEDEISTEAHQVAERVRRLKRDFGAEPVGFFRSGNPTLVSIGQKIVDFNPEYVNFLD